jgi:hypothetical protein
VILLILCFASILLSWPYVVWAYGMYAVGVGLSLVLAVRVAGFWAHHICWLLYALFLKTVVRNSSSWLGESWSHSAVALCIREATTDCLFAG